jgi:hypothetical protein
LPGTSPNPGGRSRKQVEMEAILDDELRSPEEVRETLRCLKTLAREGTEKGVYFKGVLVATEREFAVGYMQMLLDRTLGPVKEIPVDLSGVSESALAELRQVLKQ